MEDSEIIKAFELCQLEDTTVCESCPFGKYYPCCDDVLAPAILDLITRLQKENKRLKKENHQFADIGKMYSEVKADACKEFAERCKKRASMYGFGDKSGVWVNTKDIDNLLKEMVGEDNERTT